MISTLHDFFNELSALLTDEDISQIKNMSQREVFFLHHSLGLFIRNKYIYGSKSPFAKLLLGHLHDEDGISTFLLQSFRLYLKKEPLSIDVLCSLLSDRFWDLSPEEAKNIASLLLANRNA